MEGFWKIQTLLHSPSSQIPYNCLILSCTSSVQLPLNPLLDIPSHIDHYKLISEKFKNKNNHEHGLRESSKCLPSTNSSLYQEDHNNAKCNNILKQLAWNKEKLL